MNLEIIPLLSFVMITTFTPGPNNISSASLGIVHGYKKTVNYLIGIAAGFFLVMMACAFLSGVLLTFLPSAERYLRWIGAGYIVWLAIGMIKANPSNSGADKPEMAFTKGFMLQLCNPKVAVYGLTLYSTFLAPLSSRTAYLALSAGVFAMTAFLATSTWALFGAAISAKLQNDSFRKRLNGLLSILLIYTAIQLSGLLPYLGN